MRIFQTPTGSKKNLWHILEIDTDMHISPLCNGFGYWVGGYHNDKPEMTKKACKQKDFDATENICPACVQKAYMNGLIKITIK